METFHFIILAFCKTVFNCVSVKQIKQSFYKLKRISIFCCCYLICLHPVSSQAVPYVVNYKNKGVYFAIASDSIDSMDYENAMETIVNFVPSLAVAKQKILTN